MSQIQKNTIYPNDPYKNRVFNLPNALTMLRLLLVPVLYYVFIHIESQRSIKIISFVVFIVAMTTDFLDGLIARKMHDTTFLGTLLDPLADKLMITTALILLLNHHIVAPWIVIVLLSRELVINTLKALASQYGLILSSSMAGKSKTLIQSYGIGFTFLGSYSVFGMNWMTWQDLGLFTIYIAVALSIYSAGEYFIDFFKRIKNTAS